MASSSLVSTRSLPTALTGPELAVSDFAMTKSADGTLYLVSGQSSTGDLVPLDAIGVWTSSNGWTTQAATGDVPAGRVGATLVAHPSLDILCVQSCSPCMYVN